MDENEDTMLSRATREKLTINPALTIRQTESMAKDIQMLADLRGMERSEYIRHLVAQDKAEQHRIWLARNQLFLASSNESMNTAPDAVGRES